MQKTLMQWLSTKKIRENNYDIFTPTEILELVSDFLEEKERERQEFYKKKSEQLDNLKQ
jgi:hypothetical protein